jgi:hypothetical protein
MTKEATMLRRAAVLAAGLAMTACAGLAGAAPASAVSPALKIKPGSQWHDASASTSCDEVITFAANNTFTADKAGDAGTWSGGGTTLTMRWTAGGSTGVVFKGTFTTTPDVEYLGKFSLGGTHESGELVKGPGTGC